jgi:alanine-glyoxylate transaminase/serine-glyoxylate transaminase/serine-pyruvate transaminase
MDYTRQDPLLMIPGPTPLSDAVRAALAAPLRGHATPETAASIGRIRAGIRVLVGAPHADVYVIPGSGTLAMEIALVNHVRPGERVVVVNEGFFAARFADICAAHGIRADEVRAPWGRRVDVEAVREALGTGPTPALLTITHVDTSTGTQAAVADLVQLAHDAGLMVLVDGVCATAGVPESLEDWGVDLLVTASQKALSAPPGLAVVVAGERARARRASSTPGFYMDLDRWDAPMTSTAYFATHATGLLRALDVSMGEILSEGLEARYLRHRAVADQARAGFAELGFHPMTETAALAPTLSVLAPPDGVDEARLREDMLEMGVLVAGGIGPFAGRAIRVGHMGTSGPAEVAIALAAARQAVERQRA